MTPPLPRSRRLGATLAAALVGLSVCSLSPPSHAYSYETLQTTGCHEKITQLALERIRAEFDTAPTMKATKDDQVAIDDLPFTVDSSIYRDIGAVTLLIGVRDNDLKGRSGLSAQELAQVHGLPSNQKEHCLRRPDHDEPTGTEEGLEDCRSFILRRFDQALEGFDESGRPRHDDRVSLDVNLAFRGRVTLSLPRTYLRLGQALHAVQDGFTHTMRTSDGRRVTVMLNWYDVVEGQHVESRDGPPHMSDLDDCQLDASLIQDRRGLAEDASTALMRAAFDPSLTADEKHDQALAVLDDYFTYEPGCTAADDWCNAPENEFRDGTCICQHPGGNPSGGGGWAALALLAGVALGRRHRESVGRGHRRRRLGAFTAACLVAFALTANDASAHDESNWNEEKRTGIGFHSAVGGALDNGALALALGARYGITNNWLVGLDAEYNPWFSFDARRFSRGVASSYLVGIYRFPVSDDLALRTTVKAGASVMLFDLVGVPAGSVGPFFALTPLGVSYEMASNVYLVVDPVEIAIPVPQITGAPYAYRQYRFMVGFQLGS